MKWSYLPTINTGSANPIKGHSMIFVLASQNGARALGQRIHVGKSCRKVENTGVVVPRKSHVQQKTASKNAKNKILYLRPTIQKFHGSDPVLSMSSVCQAAGSHLGWKSVLVSAPTINTKLVSFYCLAGCKVSALGVHILDYLAHHHAAMVHYGAGRHFAFPKVSPPRNQFTM